MEQKMYSCDGGSLLIGNGKFNSQFPNNYGDGCHTVFVLDDIEDIRSSFGDRYDFLGAVAGTDIKVFEYDCLTAEECEKQENVLFTLTGRYGVYALKNSGDMILEKWS